MKKIVPDQLLRQKHFLRMHFREEVRSKSLAERRLAGRAVARRLAALPDFRRAKKIGLYLSLPLEIDTVPLIALGHAEGKTLAVPVVFPRRGEMRFAVLAEGKPLPLVQKLQQNVYGILEPVFPRWVEGLDLLVVPGSAFTSQGDRLGAGIGYYDRFLARSSSLGTIGVCFDEQVAVRLPRTHHDRKVDGVVTPSRVYRTRRA
jgi:5-formyltetrahydrofolate cyclo-ligase